MKKFFKNNAKVFVLAIATIAMGVTVFSSNLYSTTTKSTKVNNNDNKEGYNYSYNNKYDNVYYDEDGNMYYEYSNGKIYDEYGNIYNEDNNLYYEDEYGNVHDIYGNTYYEDEYGKTYDQNGNLIYTNNNSYNNNYNNNNYNNGYNYNLGINEAPAVTYNKSVFLNLFESFDPYKLIETQGKVTVLYNNVDNTKIGNYSVSYSVCNRYNSSACRYVNITVNVRDNNNRYEQYEEYDDQYAASAKWEKVSTAKCTVGSSSCLAENLNVPKATDPYTNRELNVRILSNNINIYKAGVYNITYKTVTSHGIESTLTRQVQVMDSNNSYQSNIYNGNARTKQINKYEWKNVVTYTFRCVKPGSSEANAWEHVSKTNDNHATYYYNQNGYTGILNKVGFYELNPYQGADIREQLGTCNTYNEQRSLTRTWIGQYSGTVTNYNY